MTNELADKSEIEPTRARTNMKIVLILLAAFLIMLVGIFVPHYAHYQKLEELRKAGGHVQNTQVGVIVGLFTSPIDQWMTETFSSNVNNSLHTILGIEFQLQDKNNDISKFECIQHFPHLQSLLMDDTILNDEGLKSLRDLPDLETFFANNTKITGAGLVHLKASKNLRHLIAFETPFNDSGMKQVAQFKNLEWLSISQTKVTDKGLAQISGLTNLKHLVLDDQPITDAGLEHLKGLTNLVNLHLENTKVRGPGFIHLHGMTNLEELYIRNDPELPKAEIDKLQKVLPKCKIIWVNETIPNQ